MIRKEVDLLEDFKGKKCKVFLSVSDPVAYYSGIITKMDSDGIIMDSDAIIVYIPVQAIVSMEMMK
jgi:hypothetical protein